MSQRRFGDVKFHLADRGFLVTGTNGGSRIHATGKTLLEAWQEAYRQAKEMESDDPFFLISKGS